MRNGSETMEKDIFFTPEGLEKIENEIEFLKTVRRKEVADKRDAYILTDILKEVVTSGTGRNARVKGQITAGKTGTTNDKREAWFVGFTPYYTASVLLAKDNHESLGFSSDRAATLFKAIMDPIHEDLEKIDYDKPDGIYRKYVNGRYEMFKDGTTPRNVDKLYWGDDDDDDDDNNKKSDKKKDSRKDSKKDSKNDNENSNDSKSRKKKRKSIINDNENSNNR